MGGSVETDAGLEDFENEKTFLPSDRILAHQNATYSNVSWRSPHTPPNITSAIVECSKHEPSGLMRRSFSQDGNSKASHANGMQNNGCIIQKTKDMNPERINNAVGYQKRGVYANRFGRRWCISRPHGGSYGD